MTDSQGLTLRDFLDEYTAYKDIRSSTIDQYLWVIACFEKKLGREAMVSDLNRKAVNHWLSAIQKELSPHTVKSRRMTIMSFWRLATELDYVEPPRLVRKIKMPERIIETLDLEQVRELIRRADKLRGKVDGYRTRDVMRSMIQATFETSLRQSDLYRLDYEATMEASGVFQLVQVKTGHRRWVRMSAHLLDDIRSWHRGKGLIWPSMRRNRLSRILQRLGEQMGVSVNHTKLRKSAITYVESIQPGTGWIFAGHKSPTTTQQWYTDAERAYRDIKTPTVWGDTP